MGLAVSRAKLSQAMLEVLVQLPTGSTNLKEVIVSHLGLLGQMAATRDIDDAWNQTKKKAVTLHPEKFTLDARKTLKWNDGTTKLLDKEISPANLKKLNELASVEGCTVNTIVTKSIKAYKQSKG
ncbi:MAG: hypothetical protein ACHRXM_26475 [Isosphaerales bacterium]